MSNYDRKINIIWLVLGLYFRIDAYYLLCYSKCVKRVHVHANRNIYKGWRYNHGLKNNNIT